MRIRRMLDLTQPLYHNMPVLPILPPPQVELKFVGARDGWNLEQLTIALHQGTHMDAPFHLEGLTTTIDQYAVDEFQGTGVVIDLRHKGAGAPIQVADLEPYSAHLQPGTIPILCTGWCHKLAWTKEYMYQSPWLHPTAARWLVARQVRGVAIDHFSIGAQVQENEAIHRILLSARVWILEGLRIPDELFTRPTWHLLALPLLIQGASGAPARAVAIEYAE